MQSKNTKKSQVYGQELTYLLHCKENNNTRIILQSFTDWQTIVYSPKKIKKIKIDKSKELNQQETTVLT